MASSAKSWLAAAAATRAPVKPMGHMSLRTPFHFSFMRRPHTRDSYGSAIKEIASFATVEHFWAVYTHILRPSALDAPTDLFLFRHGIEPMWEDPANADGGRLVLRVRKNVTARAFEDLALCLIGEQFDPPALVCGIACCVRFQDDVLAIWLRSTSKGSPEVQAITATARRIVEIPAVAVTRDWEFKAHNAPPPATQTSRQHTTDSSSAVHDMSDPR